MPPVKASEYISRKVWLIGFMGRCLVSVPWDDLLRPDESSAISRSCARLDVDTWNRARATRNSDSVANRSSYVKNRVSEELVTPRIIWTNPAVDFVIANCGCWDRKKNTRIKYFCRPFRCATNDRVENSSNICLKCQNILLVREKIILLCRSGAGIACSHVKVKYFSRLPSTVCNVSTSRFGSLNRMRVSLTSTSRRDCCSPIVDVMLTPTVAVRSTKRAELSWRLYRYHVNGASDWHYCTRSTPWIMQTVSLSQHT